MTKLVADTVIESYAIAHSTPETPSLASLNRETYLKVMQPIMLSGHLQGSLLKMLSCMIRPKNILELGTFTGYSAICLSQGLQEEGQLHTIEINEELHDISAKYFAETGVENKIIRHTGEAKDIIPTIDTMFDMVFIDADKQNYSVYYDMVFEKLNIGGYIIADNVLFEGQVLLPRHQQSKNAMAMHAFNEKMKKDNRIEHLLLPVRDGIMIIRKVAT